MPQKVKKLLGRVVSLRNVVPFLIIIIAFFGTFVPTPFGIHRDQIILGLLAFLAIDALIERSETLANIEDDIKILKDLSTSSIKGKNFLRLRREFPRLENIIAEAQQEIWSNGIALDAIANLTSIFIPKLEEGFSIRLLAVNPQSSAVQKDNNYLEQNSNNLAQKIETNLNIIHERLIRPYPEQVTLKIIDHLPTSNYFIVDPQMKQGYLSAQTYLYQTEVTEAPLFVVSSDTDERWFNLYLENFIKLWEDANDWMP